MLTSLNRSKYSVATSARAGLPDSIRQGKAPADRAAVSKGGLEFLKRNVRPRKRIGDGRRLQSVYALL